MGFRVMDDWSAALAADATRAYGLSEFGFTSFG